MTLNGIRALILDMDGVLWRDKEALPGLVPFFDWLHSGNIPYVLATNNSTQRPQDYVAKLERLGVQGVTSRHIVTSGTATASYLLTRYPAQTPVYVVGMAGLKAVLTEAGFRVVDEDYCDPVPVVVVGSDFEFVYAKGRCATTLIRGGAAFIGTNPDITFPTPEGLIPGAGSIIAMIAAAAETAPLIIGKPEPAMFEASLRLLDVLPEQTLMVGDRLETDIFGAYRAGLKTALMLTGVTRRADVTPDAFAQPDGIFETLDELRAALQPA